jgi:hypothetical protein
MLAQETTHVWTTAFSWRVKGGYVTPGRRVHALRRKNPSRPAEMLSVGMIPDVNTRFIMMPLSAAPSSRLAATARAVTCSVHGGTGDTSNARSVDGPSRGSPIDSIPPARCPAAALPDRCRCERRTANACKFDRRTCSSHGVEC